MRKELVKFDLSEYNNLYGTSITTPTLEDFLKLPLGTILYHLLDDKLVVLRSFGDLFITGEIETSAYLYNYNFSLVKSKIVKLTIPDRFYISSFNTASTLKLIKNGALMEESISNRMNYYVLDEKLTSAIIPRYQSIKSLIKANSQYNTLLKSNPSLNNNVDVLV